MDTLFFWLSKLVWLFFSPDILLVVFLAVSLMLLYMGQYNTARQWLSGLILFMVILTVLPVGDWLYYPLEKRFPPCRQLPPAIDGVIVLGGADNVRQSFLWQQVELNRSAERFFAFIQLATKYPHARHVFTGGSGSLSFQAYKGADVAKQLFKEQGLDVSSIIFESQSRNTFENALFTRKLVNPKPREHWVLITSAAHMPRSVGVFSKVGWQVIPYPVDHATHGETLFRLSLDFSGNLGQLKRALQEWTGLAAYYLTGRTTHFFPGPMAGNLL